MQAQSSVMNGTHVRPRSVSSTTDKFSDGVSSTTHDGHSSLRQTEAVGHNQELHWSVILSGHQTSLCIVNHSLIDFVGHFTNHLCDKHCLLVKQLP